TRRDAPARRNRARADRTRRQLGATGGRVLRLRRPGADAPRVRQPVRSTALGDAAAGLGNVQAEHDVAARVPGSAALFRLHQATAAASVGAAIGGGDQRVVGEAQLVDVIGGAAGFDHVHVHVFGDIAAGIGGRSDGVETVA